MIFRKQSNVFFTPFLLLTAQMLSFLWQFDLFLKTATVYHENEYPGPHYDVRDICV